MRLAVHIIGWLIVAEGLLFLLKPALLGPVLRFFSSGFWIYTLSVVRIAIAVIFLLGASQCRYPGVIAAFGILLLIAGVAILVVKRAMLINLMQWWQERNLTTVRFIGAIVMLIGAVVVYCA